MIVQSRPFQDVDYESLIDEENSVSKVGRYMELGSTCYQKKKEFSVPERTKDNIKAIKAVNSRFQNDEHDLISWVEPSDTASQRFQT